MSFWLVARSSEGEGRHLKHDLLDPPNGRIGPYDLKAWANREGLEIDYIDNCYLKVAVERSKLSAYLTELYGPDDPFPALILSVLGLERKFTIAAEEF